MKKKIIFLVLIAAIGGTWVLLANKFERKVTNKYLPHLMKFKEKGWIDYDADNVKIEKYKFKVVVDNFSFDLTGYDKTKIDRLSAYYNPFTDNVIIYTSGDRLSIGTGELETYIINPSESIEINRGLLNGNIDNVDIVLSSKKYELLSAADNSVLSSSGAGTIHLKGKLDKNSNRYSLKLDIARNDVMIKPGLLTYLKKVIKNQTMAKKGKEEEQITQAVFSFIDYSYNVINLTGPVNYKWNLGLNLDKKYLEEFIRVAKHEMRPEELFFNFTDDEIFDIDFNVSHGNNISSTNLMISYSGDGKVLKSKVDVESKSNYSPEQKEQVTNFASEFLANIFNIFKLENNIDLATKDFNVLANYITNIQNMHCGANTSYILENSDFDAALNFSLNDYKLDLNASGGEGKSYTGALKLSDPNALIAAKTKFTKEVVTPLLEKTGFSDKKDLVKIEKIAENIEANGFEVLKALSADPELKAGDNFQASFSFDPDSFTFISK